MAKKLDMFENVYKDKIVLITGNTGFKGSWLTSWLLKLGAKVIGVSKDIPTDPAMFDKLELRKRIEHYDLDIRDFAALDKVIKEKCPDFIFHLAAQAIVSTSYNAPVDTISTNVMGTTNLLESLRTHLRPCTAILITSDKCYDNVEWIWGYRETDKLGGKDIYSGSKAAAEIVINSYSHSFFASNHPVKIGIGRAGNVIGGGDWAQDRIVVDCVKSWSMGKPVEIRSPSATRPWQHVLEPVSGYLTLGHKLYKDAKLHGEAFNFGPKSEQNHRVIDLLVKLARFWGFKDPNSSYKITANTPFHEAGLLKLNCDKALFELKWESNLSYDETIELTGEWYRMFYKERADMWKYTLRQIEYYENEARAKSRIWA